MKAIRVYQFGGPEVLQLEEVPELRPGLGQVLVRARAIGVNPVETYLRSGSNPNLRLPYTPGLDAAGLVEEIGANVLSAKVGDRVYTSGTITGAYAERMLCEASDVHPISGNTDFSQAAGVDIPYATAYRALFQKARAVPGETVLIHGASGGVGTAAVQWARAAGLVIIGTAGTEEGRQLALRSGAHHVLDHRAPNYLADVKDLTNGKGADIILEMLANVNLGKDLPVLAQEGRVVVIGSRGKVEITPRDAMTRDTSILAMTLFNASASELAKIHAAIAVGLENGALRPVIGKEIPLAEAARAHEAVMQPGAYGKIVLIP